jgi:hypothetical protein
LVVLFYTACNILLQFLHSIQHTRYYILTPIVLAYVVINTRIINVLQTVTIEWIGKVILTILYLVIIFKAVMLYKIIYKIQLLHV